MTTPRERAEAQRQSKLLSIKRQVKAGKLVVRQMTPAERAEFPPLPEARRGKSAARDRRATSRGWRPRPGTTASVSALYRARAYGSDTTTPGRLRELERAAEQAEQRLRNVRETDTAK